VQRYHNQMDIFANLSFRESFGVSVLEASACGKPVIVSNAEGLKEVFIPGKTGISVGIENVEETAAAISTLIRDAKLREQMGEEGRKMVMEKFSWEESCKQLVSVYNSFGNS